MSRDVIIDCDTGIDDCLALMYLCGLHRAGQIRLRGVTTTAGNTTAAQAAMNSAWVLVQCGITDVPVLPGKKSPTVVDLVTTPETHGPTGLGYVTANKADAEPLVVASQEEYGTWDQLWHQYEDAHLIITGPATNWASFGPWAGEKTLMGGAYNYPGNTTPTAEWNTWVDPHAAKAVFAPGFADASSSLVTVCSLGVTESFTVHPDDITRYSQILSGLPIAQSLSEILRFYFEFHETQGEGYLAQIHDALTAMIALDDVDYSWQDATVDVEADSLLMRGTTVADTAGHFGRASNAHIVTWVDIEQAHDRLTHALRLLAA